jgi:hypothetical protein
MHVVIRSTDDYGRAVETLRRLGQEGMYSTPFVLIEDGPAAFGREDDVYMYSRQ